MCSKTIGLGIVGTLLLFVPVAAGASAPNVYTNENIHTSTHEAPLQFAHDANGNMFGHTVTGRPFSQIVLDDLFGIRMHKFQIDEAYFYVTDRGVIFADSALVAASIYLSRVS